MNILCFHLCYVCWHALNVPACSIEVEYHCDLWCLIHMLYFDSCFVLWILKWLTDSTKALLLFFFVFALRIFAISL